MKSRQPYEGAPVAITQIPTHDCFTFAWSRTITVSASYFTTTETSPALWQGRVTGENWPPPDLLLSRRHP